MGDMLKTGAEWLEGERKSHLASAITYTRGIHSVSVLATIGRTEFNRDQGDGIIINDQIRDYIITVADLILNGVLVQPRRGDLIVEDAAPTLTYQVLPPEGTEQSWRFSDDHRFSYRIHTRLIEQT